MWIIEDNGNEKEIAKAKENIQTANKKREGIENFLMNGIFDEMVENFEDGVLTRPSAIEFFCKMDEYSGYAFSFDYNKFLRAVKTIEFTSEENLEKITELPDLSEFEYLEKLLLTGTSIKELPDYIREKEKKGNLEIIY